MFHITFCFSLVFKHVERIIISRVNQISIGNFSYSLNLVCEKYKLLLPFFFFRTSAEVFQESVRKELWPLFYGGANALTATRLKTKTLSKKRAHHSRIFLRIRPQRTTRHVALISFSKMGDFQMLQELYRRFTVKYRNNLLQAFTSLLQNLIKLML